MMKNRTMNFGETDEQIQTVNGYAKTEKAFVQNAVVKQSTIRLYR